jgi:predicted DCC family thiol-disulfide oxidoreductase YuxK
MNDTRLARPPIEVWIDGSCAVCQRSRRWCDARDPRGRFVFRDLHLDAHPPAGRDRLLEAVHVRAADGSVAVGYEAWRRILLELDGWRWLGRLGGLPGIRSIGSLLYSIIAANRHRIGRRLG